MKRQVLTYIKPAKELKEGDRILTNRMAVDEITSVEITQTWTSSEAVHIRTKNGGIYFLDHEFVLVVE